MVSIVTKTWFDGIDVADGHISPLHRQQVSTTLGGLSTVIDQGVGLWTCGFTTVAMPLEDAYQLKTEIMSLEGSLGTVLIYDKRRPYPKNYVAATHGADGLHLSYGAVSSDCKTLTMNTATNAYSLSVGDYFEPIRPRNTEPFYLHRVTKVVGNQVTVWPPLSTNLSKTSAFSIISVEKPSAKFRLNPNVLSRPVLSVSGIASQATVTFSGVQSLI